MLESVHERRRALRVKLRTYSNLKTADGCCTAHLINLSETGALVGVLDPHSLVANAPVSLEVELPDGHQLTLEGHIAHVKEHLIGLECRPVTDADAAGLHALIEQMAPQLQA